MIIVTNKIHPNINFHYGYTTNQIIVDHIIEICDKMDPPELRPLSENFIMEIVAQETRFGRYPDHTRSTGIGLTQFDPVGFNDILLHSTEYFEFIRKTWGIQFHRLAIEDLRYQPFLALIATRLKIKRIPTPIPPGPAARFSYYKKHWNSYQGAATAREYTEKITWLTTHIPRYTHNQALIKSPLRAG